MHQPHHHKLIIIVDLSIHQALGYLGRLALGYQWLPPPTLPPPALTAKIRSIRQQSGRVTRSMLDPLKSKTKGLAATATPMFDPPKDHIFFCVKGEPQHHAEPIPPRQQKPKPKRIWAIAKPSSSLAPCRSPPPPNGASPNERKAATNHGKTSGKPSENHHI